MTGECVVEREEVWARGRFGKVAEGGTLLGYVVEGDVDEEYGRPPERREEPEVLFVPVLDELKRFWWIEADD
jgi:hypothetical protein